MEYEDDRNGRPHANRPSPLTKSGLIEAQRILEGIEGIAFIEMNKKDIIRHKLVTRIVEAYNRDDERRKKLREEKGTEADPTSAKEDARPSTPPQS